MEDGKRIATERQTDRETERDTGKEGRKERTQMDVKRQMKLRSGEIHINRDR